MADPAHIPEMDGFDRLTVRLYRGGLALQALGVLSLGVTRVVPSPQVCADGSVAIVLGGTGLSVACMHLYDKRIRWVIGAAAWTGALLLVSATLLPPTGPRWVHHAGLGFAFVAISAFALKEQFCFRIPLLRTIPALLALSLLPLLTGSPGLAAAALLPAGALHLLLAIQKARMPLHFDVGDRSHYQI